MTDLSPQLKVLRAMLYGRTRYDIGLPDHRDAPNQAAAMLDIIRSAEAAYDHHSAIAAGLRPGAQFVFDASLWDRLEDFSCWPTRVGFAELLAVVEDVATQQ